MDFWDRLGLVVWGFILGFTVGVFVAELANSIMRGN